MVPASLSDRFVIRFCVCAQRATESDIHTAYQIISRFSSDLYEILKIDEKARQEEEDYNKSVRKEVRIEAREEDESVDEVFVLDRKKKMSLRYKRSFFVRMVSDPKLYNPKIVKASGTRSVSDKDSDGDPNDDQAVVTPL
jgi:aromatic-L-amino-acid decarboxylase